MKKGGSGGGRTKSGLYFEKNTDLKKAFNLLDGFYSSENKIYYKNKLVGEIFQKHQIYAILCKRLKINWKKKISAQLLPDDAFFDLNSRILTIIEKKFQQVEGSVYEKIQTCDFKIKQYRKLFAEQNISIQYYYLLNDWFKKDKFNDIFTYVRDSGCNYYFNEIPINKLIKNLALTKKTK